MDKQEAYKLARYAEGLECENLENWTGYGHFRPWVINTMFCEFVGYLYESGCEIVKIESQEIK